jgi:hypothetical protein
LTHKTIPVAVNGAYFWKSIVSKYEKVIYDLKNEKKWWPILNFFLFRLDYAEQS